MEYRTLGRSGISVSAYCLGTMMFGAWGNPDADACTRMVNRALDAGVNFVDTADVYDDGTSEQIVGNALKGRRDDVVLATKCNNPMGPDPNQRGNSRRWIMRAVEDSLRRLHTDWIDLYQIHRPDPTTDIDETLGALSDLVRAGKVRAIGSSTFPSAQLVESQWVALTRNRERFTAEQPPYSILARGIESDVLPVCVQYGIGVISWAPLNGGWLSGKYAGGRAPSGSRADREPEHFDFKGPVHERKLEVVDRLTKVAGDAGISLMHMAHAFVLAHPAVSSVIMGPRMESQLDEVLAGTDLRLDASTLDAIDVVVPPGVNINPNDAGYVPPALTDARQRPAPAVMTAGAEQRARDVVDANAPRLVGLSHRVHDTPELGYEEVKSSRYVAGVLADAGLSVDLGIHDLPTAFRCSFGDGPLEVAICAEYDALPAIGHACGHNMISAIAVGAALALAPIVDDIGLRVTVIGTPAEELGGGKVLLLERGAFDGIHAAMMVHPTPYNDPTPRVSAARLLAVRYRGREAHAAAAPERGVKPGDALTIAQVAVGLLRQHLRRYDQVHGIVRHGGDAPNVIPGEAHGSWIVRAEDTVALAQLRRRVERCFEAGALATGAELELVDECPQYTQLVHDRPLVDVFCANSEALGRPMNEPGANTFSTDMGNVSLALPSIHPCVGIDADGSVNHQAEFAAACVNASADRAVLEASTALAWTAIDIATGPLAARLFAHDRAW